MLGTRVPVAAGKCVDRVPGRSADWGRGIGGGRGGPGGRRSARRDGHRDRRRNQPVPYGRHQPERRLRRPGARARLLSGSRRAERIPAVDPRRHSARHRRDGSTGPAAAARRTDRGHHGHGRRAVAPQRDFRARSRRRQQKGRRPAAQWPELHHAREPGAWRGAATATRGAVAAHQRRTAPHERVSVRRDFGVAARAWAGRILSERRRDPGVQDRKQQPARGVWALQRWRGQPDDQIGEQCISRHRL